MLLIYIHFIQAWEEYLLANKAAFLFEYTYVSKDLFTTLNGAQAPQAFAVRFARNTFKAPAMLTPSSLLEDTIGAMLAFWDDRASTWKKGYGSREATRLDLKTCSSDHIGHDRYGKLSKNDAAFPLQVSQGKK
jgi:hypothetical protein